MLNLPRRWGYSRRQGVGRFDVQLVRVRFTDAPYLLCGIDATQQSKLIRRVRPYPKYFRFREAHPAYRRQECPRHRVIKPRPA